jgi:hypothetical protein
MDTSSSSSSTSSSSSSPSAPASLHPLLLRVQLALESGSVCQAQQLLQGVGQELVMAPALMATRVTLHEQVGGQGGRGVLLLHLLDFFLASPAITPLP